MITQRNIAQAAVFALSQLASLAPAVNAGWFGYQSYSECFRAERMSRMDRWVNPMNRKDASIAARDACYEYKKPKNGDCSLLPHNPTHDPNSQSGVRLKTPRELCEDGIY